MAGTALMVTTARKLGAVALADNSQYRNRLQIQSGTSSRLYVVAQNKTTDVWSCGCMGWIRHRHCKHLTVMVPVLTAALKTVALKG